MKQIITYLKEVRNEMKKVEWPKKNQVVKLTSIVILVSVLVGVYLGGLDYLFTNLFKLLLVK